MRPSHIAGRPVKSPIPATCPTCIWLQHQRKLAKKSEAQAAVKNAIQLQPALSISFTRSGFVGVHETTLNSLLDSLRKAGVPE